MEDGTVQCGWPCLAQTNRHRHTSHTNKGTDQIGRLGGSEIQEGKAAKPWHAAWRRDRLNKMTHLVILCQRLHHSFWGKVTTIILGQPFTFTDRNHGNKQPLPIWWESEINEGCVKDLWHGFSSLKVRTESPDILVLKLWCVFCRWLAFLLPSLCSPRECLIRLSVELLSTFRAYVMMEVEHGCLSHPFRCSLRISVLFRVQ